jgi:glycosyltransferase involved in cell wall biosynthesis
MLTRSFERFRRAFGMISTGESQRTPRIAAYLGIFDEAELIRSVIDHLRSIGIDLIIAFDSYSTDGTAEILESYRSDNLQVFKIANDEPGKEWLRKICHTVKQFDVDWVVFQDADEFLLPATGSLRDCRALAGSDVIHIPRYNVAVGPGGPMMPDVVSPSRYDDVQLIVRPIPDIRQHLQHNPMTPGIRIVPGPKTMARPSKIGALIDGMHDIIPISGQNLRKSVAEDLLIAHLPITTKTRFRRKVDNIRECFKKYDQYFGPNTAWHWRRLLEIDNRGGLEEEFDRSVFSPELFRELKNNKIIQTAAQMLSNTRRASRK